MKKKIVFAALAVVAVVVVCTIPGGCQFMVMDVPSALTSWLDFQEFPKEMEALYARDFTGKTKQEMLAEFLAVDAGRTNWAGRVTLSVMLPENAQTKAEELLKDAGCPWERVRVHHHVLDGVGTRWHDWDDGIMVPIDPRNPTALCDYNGKPSAWYSFCMEKSCCWALFHRRYDGETYQMWGFRYYCMLIVEFDDSGRVARQYPVNYGVGDG
jgi:hypothetical protein